MRRPMDSGAGRKNEGPHINGAILSPEIRLIDETGENVGVTPLRDALARAKTLGLDLVEIVPNSVPPVCKIMDYRKFKYQEQKKNSEAKKKQKTVEIKEIKVRPNIDIHDYNVKLRAVHRFLEEGNKVKVTLRFRGREIAHAELGLAVLHRIQKDTEEVAKLDQPAKIDGRFGLMVLSPKI